MGIDPQNALVAQLTRECVWEGADDGYIFPNLGKKIADLHCCGGEAL